MADHSNIVAETASTLVEFSARWVQSATADFDILVACTMDREWARVHKPVISTKGDGHMLYTKWQVSEPDGKRVICHRNCEARVNFKPRKESVKYNCTHCNSTTSTPLSKRNKATILGHWELTKTPFPQEQYPTEWELPKPTYIRSSKSLLPPRSKSTTPASITPTATPPPSTESDSEFLQEPGPSNSKGRPVAARRQRRR